MDQQQELQLPSLDRCLNRHGRNLDTDEFDKFLDKVNKISSVIEDMQSPDPTISSEAVSRAEAILAAQKDTNSNNEGKIRTKYNRTVLNRNILDETPVTQHPQAAMSTAEFMAAVEKDAAERTSRRARRKINH